MVLMFFIALKNYPIRKIDMKIKPGKDEFCMHCMEWREYDNEGRCIACHNKIVKLNTSNQKGYNEVKTEDSFYEYDDDIEEY